MPITRSVVDDEGEGPVPGSSGLQGITYNHVEDKSQETSQFVGAERQLDFFPENQLGLHDGLWPLNEEEEEEQYFRRIGRWVQQLPDVGSGKYFYFDVKLKSK